MKEYKYKSDFNPNKYYGGTLDKNGPEFSQVIGGHYVEVDKNRNPIKSKKKMKEQNEPEDKGNDSKLMLASRIYLIKYLKSMGVTSSYSNVIADNVYNLVNNLIDAKLSGSIISTLSRVLEKFYSILQRKY